MLKTKRPVQIEHSSVEIHLEDATLSGQLFMPNSPRGLVLFVHGSGNSQHSPHDQVLASELEKDCVATLLFDLLTPREEGFDLQTAELRNNIPFLAGRLTDVMRWLNEQPKLASLRKGLFGISTGGAAALVAAANDPHAVEAIVLRSGRPDLAGQALPDVLAPSLFIVGEKDADAVKSNERAIVQMRCEREMKIIPGATHLFNEHGTLGEVSALARSWFKRYLLAHPYGEWVDRMSSSNSKASKS